MQGIFQEEVQGEEALSPLALAEEGTKISSSRRDYIVVTYEEFLKHREEIDSIIDRAAEHWDIKHMPKAELAILRLAVTEICYVDTVPTAVAINEAVELAKLFGEPKASSFVNGVLGRIARDLEAAEAKESEETVKDTGKAEQEA